MKDRQWYAARITEPLLGFDVGDIVYIRKAVYATPLTVGPVVILFHARSARSVRVADQYGKPYKLLPNNVNPLPAPPEKNAAIEEAYREFRKSNPLHKRVKAMKSKFEAMKGMR